MFVDPTYAFNWFFIESLYLSKDQNPNNDDHLFTSSLS